jgi:hypothetical protein
MLGEEAAAEHLDRREMASGESNGEYDRRPFKPENYLLIILSV